MNNTTPALRIELAIKEAARIYGVTVGDVTIAPISNRNKSAKLYVACYLYHHLSSTYTFISEVVGIKKEYARQWILTELNIQSTTL